MAMCLIDIHIEIIHNDDEDEVRKKMKKKKWPNVWKFFNML